MTRALTAAAMLLASQCFAAEQGVHPPYPDRWIWSPGVITEERSSTWLHRMPNGDVLVAHDSEAETFFGRVRYASVEAVFDSKYPPPDDRRRILLKGGAFALGLADECFPVNSISIRDAQDRQLRSAAFLLLLDQPVQRQATVCEEQERPAWASRVVLMQPASLLALEDGTFLVIDGTTGTVVRVSADLTVNTPSVKAIDSETFFNGMHEFERARPAYGIDWPAYMDHLQRIYFDSNGQLPARLLGTWLPIGTGFLSFGELRLTPETLSWSDCLFEEYRVIRAQEDRSYRIEVLRSPPCKFGPYAAFLGFEFSPAARENAVEVKICRTQDEFDRPPRQNYCSWGVLVKKEPVEDSAAAPGQ